MKGQDPLALAIFGAALALLAGLLLYVFFFRTPEPAPAGRTLDVVDELRRRVETLTPKPAGKPSAGASIQAGRSWRYRVDVSPQVWRNVTLTYRTQVEGAGIGVLTEFVHAGGKSNFHLGTFAAGHPSHANTRFPGFFMYAAYLQPPFTVGMPVIISWPWQGGGNRPGRVKRFEGKLVAWEELKLQAGTFKAAKIEGWLRYLENEAQQVRVYEAFWYAPQLGQVVKVWREGHAPDEAARLIIAELVEFR